MIPKRPLLRKNCECSGSTEFNIKLRVLDSFLSGHHPTSIKDIPLFNKSKIFTLSLKLNALEGYYMPFLS
jgi:hypothetical protein